MAEVACDCMKCIKEASARSLIIQLTNRRAATLSNPLVYLSTGQVLDPPPPTIPENEKATFSFCKHDTLLEAVYGVMTYDVCDMYFINGQKVLCRLAIMFSVPQDRVSYKNEFGIGVISPETPCDEKLLQAMCSGKDPNFKRQVANGCQLRFSRKRPVLGTMSQTAHATIKVEIYNDEK